MPAPTIRPIAIGLIWRGDRLLVSRGFDASRNAHFYRPPGGGIEFGEYAADALRREFIEELQAEVVAPRLLVVLENPFHYEGVAHHEIVFVFATAFADPAMYERESFTVVDAGVYVCWRSLAEMASAGATLYPTGLEDALVREH